MPVILLTLVNVLGFSLLIPVLPFVVSSYWLSQAWYWAMLSIYAGSLFFGAPLFWSLSDHYGRKPMLLISHIWTLLSWFIFAIAYFVPAEIQVYWFPVAVIIILVSRFLDWITWGNNSIVNALITDVTTPDQRWKAFWMVWATFGVWFMIWPLIWGLTSQTSIGYLWTIIFAICLSFLTLFSIITFIKEPVREVKATTISVKKILTKLNVFKTLWWYKKRTVIREVLLVKLFVILAFSWFTSIMSLFLIDRFWLNSWEIWTFLFVIWIYAIINQWFLVPKLLKKIGWAKALVFWSLLLTIWLWLQNRSISIVMFALVAYIHTLWISIMTPTIKMILSQNAKDWEQWEVLWIDESLQSFWQAVMPIISASLYIYWGQTMFLVLSLFIFITALPLTLLIVKEKL